MEIFFIKKERQLMEKLKRDLKEYRNVIICVGVYLILMQLIFSELCPIKILTGHNCPRMWVNTCINLFDNWSYKRSNRSKLYSIFMVDFDYINYNR